MILQNITYPSYRLSIDDWIIFEATDKQMELRVIYDKVVLTLSNLLLKDNIYSFISFTLSLVY
jgi:hypothetical protein